MKAISFSLAVAFGLAVGLSACQDQSVVAPDDEVYPLASWTLRQKREVTSPGHERGRISSWGSLSRRRLGTCDVERWQYDGL